MGVEPLGEGLGEAVGERLEQDVRIIVIVGLEAGEVRLEAVDPTAKPPIQSSPSGSMKSARHILARPSRFFTCWRRKGSRVQSLPARTSTSSPSRRQRHRPTVPRGGQPMLGDDPVEHRLGVGEQGAWRSRRPPRPRGWRDSCRPAPRRGRRASSRSRRARSRSGHSPKLCTPGRCGGGALPAGSKAKPLARASSSVASSFWPLPARVSRTAS